jgi:hypothetical protein
MRSRPFREPGLSPNRRRVTVLLYVNEDVVFVLIVVDIFDDSAPAMILVENFYIEEFRVHELRDFG